VLYKRVRIAPSHVLLAEPGEGCGNARGGLAVARLLPLRVRHVAGIDRRVETLRSSSGPGLPAVPADPTVGTTARPAVSRHSADQLGSFAERERTGPASRRATRRRSYRSSRSTESVSGSSLMELGSERASLSCEEASGVADAWRRDGRLHTHVRRLQDPAIAGGWVNPIWPRPRRGCRGQPITWFARSSFRPRRFRGRHHPATLGCGDFV